ncbi:CASTOR/POLLUX-related putative ion channel [Streptomyces sp. NPDC054887]
MASEATSRRRRLRYRVDNLVGGGTAPLIGWLSLACLFVVVPASVVLVWADRDAPVTLSGRLIAVWASVGQTLKIGGAVGPPLYVLASVSLALVALLFVSTLVSLITTGINQRIMALRLGHSTVVEEQHTVVLGWSDQVFPVVMELVAANANRRRAAVAVLAPKDKVEMEEEIAAQVPRAGVTRIICRNGRTTDPTALARVSPRTAKAVLVLPSDGDEGDTGDLHVVKTLLALNSPASQTGSAVVVAAVREAGNHVTATLAAPPGAHVVNIDDIVARLLVQTSRQPGLSLVYQELLNFDGDEIYTVAAPSLTGRTFGEALLSFTGSSVIGLLRDGDAVALNPDPDTVIGHTDRIVVVSRDDDTAAVADTPPAVDEDAIVSDRSPTPRAERLLLLGWNRRAALVVEQLDHYVSPGTTLDVVALGDGPTMRGAYDVAGSGRHLEVSVRSGDITDPRTLTALDVPSYDSVIVVGDKGVRTGSGATGQAVEADDRTLVTLLHLRAVEEATRRELSVTTELSDDRNRLLAPVREGADFIVSSRLISQLMTQISEGRHLAGLFDELFSAAGSEIYLRPAAQYVLPGREVAFATVVESARRRRECALGYRLHARSSSGPDYGVRINPDKRHRVRFTAGDRVIVLAR